MSIGFLEISSINAEALVASFYSGGTFRQREASRKRGEEDQRYVKLLCRPEAASGLFCTDSSEKRFFQHLHTIPLEQRYTILAQISKKVICVT